MGKGVAGIILGSILMKRWILNEFNVKTVFIITTILYCIPLFMVWADTFVNILVLWAGIVTLWDLINRRDILKSHSALVGILFLACFLCTIFFNKFSSVNIKIMIYMFLQLCFFTYFDCRKTKEDVLNELHKISNIVIKMTFVLNLISLGLFFSGYCEIFRNNVTSMELIMGRHPNSSLYGIMANSNWTSFLEVTSIGLLCFESRTRGGKMGKKRSFMLLVCIVTLFLTNSRGGLIGFFVFVVADRGLRFICLIKKNRKKAGICLLTLPFLVALIIVGNKMTKDISGEIYSHIRTMKSVVNSADNHNSSSSGTITSGGTSEIKRDREEQAGSTNVRFELWEAGIKVILENSPVGIGGAEIGEYIFEKLRENTQVDNLALASNTHNIFIQTALTTGIMGLLCILTIFAREFLYSFIYLFKYHGGEKTENTISVLLALLLTYLVINMVEADIFMSRNFMSSLFWILLGYMTRLVQLSIGNRRESDETYIYHPCTLEQPGR